MNKPSLPQGTRDFNPEIVQKRNLILNTIKSVFELYGFQPLETPAMEKIETLTGKYGEEGDKLIFRILDSGNPFTSEFFKGLSDILKDYHNMTENIREQIPDAENPWSNPLWKLNPEVLEQFAENLLKDPLWKKKYLPKLKNETSEKALRYDLTIPFARYVAMNFNKLTLPFKRYQIQPVWRADRPQKGRYREFYQCDVDVVGSNSIINEVELICIYDQVFHKLGFEKGEVTLKLNNRKIWQGVAEYCGCPDRISDITTAIDKYEKIGKTGVIEELISKGFNQDNINQIFGCLFPDVHSPFDWNEVKEDYNLSDQETSDWQKIEEKFKDTFDIIYCVGIVFQEANISIAPIKELIQILNLLVTYDLQTIQVKYDSTLARGLNYYTGAIFEVVCNTSTLKSSIGGGGRYNDLTGLFGIPNIPGIGVSFGVDRIFDVMIELGKFQDELLFHTKALFLNLSEEQSKIAFTWMQVLRQTEIACELYHENSPVNKQYEYAEKKNIPYVINLGRDNNGEIIAIVKNIRTGVQELRNLAQLKSFSFL
jgi:histidyl-tRNA synthetase